MEHVELGALIQAPARAVWRHVGDFGGNQLTRGYVQRVELRGQGIGAERVYHTEPRVGAGCVVERLTEYDDRDMVLGYRMVDNGPVPWTGYQGRITVTPAGPDACMVLICTQFVPVDASAEELRTMSRTNIEMYFDNLRSLFQEHGQK